MSNSVWLASYPKSGNPRLRIPIGCLDLRDSEPFNINTIINHSGIASNRITFDNHQVKQRVASPDLVTYNSL